MNWIGLDREKHRALKLQNSTNYGHATGHHAAALAAEEIPKAVWSYPVLFARDESGVHPVALLGLVANENQYLEGNTWLANYVPAVIRAYPFSLAGEQVLIDETSSSLGDTEGQALFDESGEPSNVLLDKLNLLKAWHAADAETHAWCARLVELGVLIERQAEVVSPGVVTYRLDGFLSVDQAKLAALPDQELAALARDGSLALLNAHLMSLENLLTLAARRDQSSAKEGVSDTEGSK